MGNGKRTGKAYQPTIPQNIMRDDILGTPTLGDVFDEEIGIEPASPIGGDSALSRWGQQEARAKQIALDIIDQYELQLSLKQWHIVTQMVEQAVMQGVQLELDS